MMLLLQPLHKESIHGLFHNTRSAGTLPALCGSWGWGGTLQGDIFAILISLFKSQQFAPCLPES